MSLPPEQYAFLASSIYDPVEVKQDLRSDTRSYRVHYVSPPSATNYRGAVVQDRTSGELIVLNKGTDPRSIHDILADIGMGAMGAPTQWPEAATTMRKAQAIAKELDIPQSAISATGHSLGGALTQLQAAAFGVHAETFNSYGAAEMAKKLGFDVAGPQQLVVNHRMYHDPVSALATSIGSTIDYMDAEDYRRHASSGAHLAQEARATLAGHGIGNFWDKQGNQPGAIFAHNYMLDMFERQRPVHERLPSGMPLNATLGDMFGDVGQPQSAPQTMQSPGRGASMDAWCEHLYATLATGDDRAFRQALERLPDSDISRQLHGHAQQRVEMQDRQAALEQQLQQARQEAQSLAQHMSAPVLTRAH
jgi:hypothetical protein